MCFIVTSKKKIISRFSEDCDITIDYRNFKPDLKLADLNRTQLKKISAKLKAQLQSYIAKMVLPHLRKPAAKLFQEKAFEIELSEAGEQLRFYYPSLINPLRGYLRDHHKKAFFNASYTHYDDCLAGKFLLIPTGIALENLKQDFKQMLTAGMFHKSPATFKTIIEGLKQLESRLNQLEMKF